MDSLHSYSLKSQNSIGPEHATQLVDRLLQQRKTGMFCDTSITVAEKCFHAHKCVLAGHSGKLDDLITNSSGSGNHAGSVEIVIELNGVKPIAFEVILDYFYTGELKVDSHTAMSVWMTAAYLELNYIVNQCNDFCKYTVQSPSINQASSQENIAMPVYRERTRGKNRRNRLEMTKRGRGRKRKKDLEISVLKSIKTEQNLDDEQIHTVEIIEGDWKESGDPDYKSLTEQRLIPCRTFRVVNEEHMNCLYQKYPDIEEENPFPSGTVEQLLQKGTSHKKKTFEQNALNNTVRYILDALDIVDSKDNRVEDALFLVMDRFAALRENINQPTIRRNMLDKIRHCIHCKKSRTKRRLLQGSELD
uniref:BTB domain-containing protein n=1 Tax=Ciona savignyi TaxID=51511 RepID=H2YFB9_CIOSA